MFITPGFITPAFAQTAAATDAAAGGSMFSAFLPVLLVFAVFYLMVIRPQNRQAKAHATMLGALDKGDKIVTGGGLIGTVKKVVSDEELLVEVAEGVQVRVVRSTVLSRKV